MKGIERQYLRECIEALCKARSALLSLTCEEAVSKSKYGKGNSLCLDAVPEIEIVNTLCKEFDPHLPLITEEIGSTVVFRDTEEEVILFSDPMDRSSVLKEFLDKKTGIVADVFKDDQTVLEWESKNGDNVELSGPYGSITAIRHHYILFNVMINYITGNIYVASDAGVGKLSMTQILEDDEQISLKKTKDLVAKLQFITFGGKIRNHKLFLTYCAGKKYEDNLIASKIFGNCQIDEIKKVYLKYSNPGGPARILYLQSPVSCGFILSNGEKIGEWLGWLAYVKCCSQELRAFEISFDNTWTRDQILMAPGPAYSILVNDIEEEKGLPFVRVKLNISKLKFLENPSRYRSTLLICPASNRDIIGKMYRDKIIELRFV